MAAFLLMMSPTELQILIAPALPIFPLVQLANRDGSAHGRAEPKDLFWK